MKNSLLLVLTAIAATALAKDDARINYVGQGRYACSGNSYKCAQIDQQNRASSQLEADRYERNRQREIDSYNRSISESRERDGRGDGGRYGR